MRSHGDASLSSPFFYRSIQSARWCATYPAGCFARVAVPSGGGLAQLGEHYVRNVGVAGSTPVPSTKSIPIFVEAATRGFEGVPPPATARAVRRWVRHNLRPHQLPQDAVRLIYLVLRHVDEVVEHRLGAPDRVW
jgi:hypothetical protein